MAQGITAVIIDSNTESLYKTVKFIKTLGGQASVEGATTSFEAGFELVHKKHPMVVILSIDEGQYDTALERIKTILTRFPRVTIFTVCEDRSAETILAFMRAGVTEYLLKPLSELDLASALQKLGRLWLVRAPEADEGKIITLFSPKGGVGVTTIALNLAVSVYQLTNQPTILVDLDLNAGDVTTFLNLKAAYTMSDVTANIGKLDKSFLQGVITRHESGIHVLADPQKVEEGVSISATEVRKVLGLLKTMFKYIILDTEPAFNERTKIAIEMSNLLFMIFIMSLPGIRNMQRYLNYLDNNRDIKEKIRLIVNRRLKKDEIKPEDAEKVLERPLFWSVPNDYDTVMACLNKGVTISKFDPKSKLNISIRDLASTTINSMK
jgi:pilus assembly protein CpaE